MRTTEKRWLLAAGVLTALGLFVVFGVRFICRSDADKLAAVKYETNTYTVQQAFRSISIVTSTDDVALAQSADETCAVVCKEQEKVRHSADVRDGTLTVRETDTRQWYERLFTSSPESPTVTVYLPQSTYETLTVDADTGSVRIPAAFRFTEIDVTTDTADVLCAADASGNVRIATDTGDVVVDSITADTLDLTVSTGDVTVRNVKCGGSAALRVSTGKAQLTGLTCGSFTSTGSTGDLTMQDVRVREKASVERSAGDVRFERCDAAEICVTTDTGDVSGSLLSDKVFFAQSDTGRIDVPKTISGGRCEIVSSTGDITMRVV
ncbi:MAG: DUF4097 family beta strand repeat protein [Clostridia bacterium]|nr:DUF4097 family beta strand repeat protein [Clostridia bacterium]